MGILNNALTQKNDALFNFSADRDELLRRVSMFLVFLQTQLALKMPETKRFADPGLTLYDLATHFVVHCPKCQGKALVASKENGQKLTCTNCFHVEKPGHWYGAHTAYVSVKCRECHAQITHSAPWNGVWKKLGTRCPECDDVCEYEAHISRHYMHKGLMTDSVYGLPLWLQKTFRGDLFWAFNYEHLEVIHQYVAANLRERGISPRNTIKKSSAMVARLPSFVTKAGNREEMLALIEELSLKTN